VQDLLQKAQSLLAEAKQKWINPGKLSWPQELLEASLYVMQGGKGARPALLYWSANSCFEKNLSSNEKVDLDNLALEAALSLEMVHVYSLVHDDLPAMDNDDYRRGKLTLHKKFDDAFAILTGDAFLTGAFEILSKSLASDYAKILMIQELSRAAGGAGMIAGQVKDLEAEKNKIEDLELWAQIHDSKTGALFGAALSMGYVLGAEFLKEKINFEKLEKIRSWGIRLGRLFQIVDDRLDKGPFYKKLGEEKLIKLCVSEAASLHEKAHELWANPRNIKSILDFFVNREE
jgi:geranylgeranyl diphosphate synthase, type II